MQLRSGKKRVSFSSPITSPLASPLFYTPKAAVAGASSVASIRDQKNEQKISREKTKMADTVAALEQCLVSTQGKVERIRRAIQAADHDYSKFRIHAIKLYVETVTNAYTEFNEFLNRIYLADPTKREMFEQRLIDFEELYEFVRISLAEMADEHENQQRLVENEKKLMEIPSNSQSASSVLGNPALVVPSLLLQQSALPTFDGRYENWYKFKGRFSDIVDKCVGDSPATKLHYLDKALVGKAAGAIDQQTLNDNNYEGAWRILTNRFENLRMVVQGHVTQLLNLKPMSKGTHFELRGLLDVVEKRLESLAFHDLKMEDKLSETIVINLISSKLDPDTRKAWESTLVHGVLPVYNSTIDFLRNHCYMLERCEDSSISRTWKSAPSKNSSSTVAVKTHTVTVQGGCPLCNKEHAIEICYAFRNLSVNSRYVKAKQLGLCFACLKRGHRTANCKVDSAKLCECQRKHHPLMHSEEKSPKIETATTSAEKGQPAECSGVMESPRIVAKCEITNSTVSAQKQILLATAVVDIIDCCGVSHKCRALLDSGAMTNFISQRLSDLLSLSKESVKIPIVGVNGIRTTANFRINAMVKSRMTDYMFSLDFLIVPRVTGALPVMHIDVSNWPIPEQLKLADPKFFQPNRVDMLIGAEVFYDLMKAGRMEMANGLPLLQESILGWLVAGPVNTDCNVTSVKVFKATVDSRVDDELNILLERFWAIDEQITAPLSDACERHFQETYSRGKDGRYIVQLPFRLDADQLGNSRSQAERRLKALENRLERCPELKRMYSDFIHEYIDLGHARVLNPNEVNLDDGYYIPHHCVLKPDSSTTRLRVVFDASAKTTTDLSLNDILMDAPTIQRSLFEIILQWRLHRFVFTADIQRMYRQIAVNDAHTKFQRCLWRDEKTQPFMDLELLRVTYGIGPAGFLATRSLNQLAKDERDNFPEASVVVSRSFYVDDVLSGADTLKEARQLRDSLQFLLLKGGFKLHKWCANHPSLLDGIPAEDRERLLCFENDVNGIIKALGLLWDPVSDDLLFKINSVAKSGVPTKRDVLSEIARWFDPLGVLGPIIVIAKMIMQQLWRKNIDWDDAIPDDEYAVWSRLRAELCSISEMRIPRRVTVDNPVKFELHGFSDASSRAYGCCVYLKTLTADGVAGIRLLCGKSRVAPLKESERKEKEGALPAEMTIPRLELCAASLLARQIKIVRETIDVDLDRIILWSDSEIVLCWLKKVKPEQSVFVRNRVAEILSLNHNVEWRYVNTKENPADLVSRGVQPIELMRSHLWWRGPDFLYAMSEELLGEQHGVEETSVIVGTMVTVEHMNDQYEMILRHSSFRQLQRIFAYVCRFVYNCRARKCGNEKRSGQIGVVDWRDAIYCMVRVVQHVVYFDEITKIQQGNPVKGKLRNVNPIFDSSERLLRVGGRIKYSDLPRDQKHPMILPERNHFTDIVIQALHQEELHTGLNGMMSKIRRQFWPVNAKRSINRVLKRCVKCFRAKPTSVQSFMGDLPSVRVTIAEPFSRTGVDYAGPLLIKQGRARGPIKAYVSVFVCMCTKAIHLELVTSLTAEGFIAALQRFVGRRGNVSDIYSDNGTNFVGARRELDELLQLLGSQMLEKRVTAFCQPRGINWHFLPPRAPHQGGLWEAGVKAMKTHLYKILNEAYLTYEEMNTVLIQIEAILNSRPLVEQSNDPTDYRALTPAHFLVGRELTAIAEPSYIDSRESTLSRYQVIQRRKQSFWRKWSTEYITGLQKRSKWYKRPDLLRNGLLVLLKEENLPPQSWRLGRIVDLHPGKDGIVRVVTVRTTGGDYKRPTTKIAVLPIHDDE